MDALEIMAKHPEEMVYVQVNPKDIDLFNKIMEAYDNTALVTTVEAEQGRLALWVTADTKEAVCKIIKKMPCRVVLLQE